MSSQRFQARVLEWTTACFPPSAHSDVSERAHRFLEEAIELAQSSNCSCEEAHALVDYVFSRPEGETFQEASLESGGAKVGHCSGGIIRPRAE